jgi:hypothetical protein
MSITAIRRKRCGCGYENWPAAGCATATGGLTVLLRREGWEVNAKRIYRLYTEEGLIVRTQKRRERAQRQRIASGTGHRVPTRRWSMDFVAQRLADGRWIRVLTVVDQYTRECLTASCRHGPQWREGCYSAGCCRRRPWNA